MAEAKEAESVSEFDPFLCELMYKWFSRPGDRVLDPFAGIGSTNYVALRMRRRTIGIELKESYYKQAIKNCNMALMEEPVSRIGEEI